MMLYICTTGMLSATVFPGSLKSDGPTLATKPHAKNQVGTCLSTFSCNRADARLFVEPVGRNFLGGSFASTWIVLSGMCVINQFIPSPTLLWKCAQHVKGIYGCYKSSTPEGQRCALFRTIITQVIQLALHMMSGILYCIPSYHVQQYSYYGTTLCTQTKLALPWALYILQCTAPAYI